MNNNHENYGYIVADTPEKIRVLRTKKSGDEIFINKHWVILSSMFGEYYESGVPVRRPIDPTPGYRIVGLDELHGASFEYTRDGVEWLNWYSIRTTRTVREILETEKWECILAIRRKVEQKEEVTKAASSPSPIPWNKFKDVMPTNKMFTNDNKLQASNGVHIWDATTLEQAIQRHEDKPYEATHWRFVPRYTDLPPQEPSESEKACNQCYADYNKTIDIENPPTRKEVWDAAWLACEQRHKEKGEK